MKLYKPKVKEMLVYYSGLGSATAYIFEDETYTMVEPKPYENHYKERYNFNWFKDESGSIYHLERDVFNLIMEEELGWIE